MSLLPYAKVIVLLGTVAEAWAKLSVQVWSHGAKFKNVGPSLEPWCKLCRRWVPVVHSQNPVFVGLGRQPLNIFMQRLKQALSGASLFKNFFCCFYVSGRPFANDILFLASPCLQLCEFPLNQSLSPIYFQSSGVFFEKDKIHCG